MIDARLVAAVVVIVVGVNAAASVWNNRARYTIPDGKALRCEVVDLVEK